MSTHTAEGLYNSVMRNGKPARLRSDYKKVVDTEVGELRQSISQQVKERQQSKFQDSPQPWWTTVVNPIRNIFNR
ncbi:3-phosphoshikimate 1-carboxyvinyltransferase [Rothia dentocariosa]|uniref:3-phosphoshikimate 1-carboxyvinyltransferase n=1 Tax=Rothia dentocariosa TaxID=2047 RepID=UPI0028F1387C|nr:3-phosphoshikimate 1-carboxyvinyltransferase [Rothia dentocariosa]